MSRTIQPRSWASLSNAGENLNENKSEIEDNKTLLLSIFDNLNNLKEKLSRLDYLLKRIEIEQNLYFDNDNDEQDKEYIF